MSYIKPLRWNTGKGLKGLQESHTLKWGKRGWFCMCGWVGDCVYATLPQFQIMVTQYSAPSAGTTLNPDLFNFQLNKKVRSGSSRAFDSGSSNYQSYVQRTANKGNKCCHTSNAKHSKSCTQVIPHLLTLRSFLPKLSVKLRSSSFPGQIIDSCCHLASD